ncbi:hypothetical protein BT63DRAFT_239579 [Microthyrium microscopicum]|uniref:Uncharacterized protein n=1 Tax=Microthyrium microscopicum TaxID=703497 RepID=A0A6A6UDY2_9PEZI|nr:hypothetical protein BT63DRAFT_239579 [Microthyrium microscopicum]
MKHTMDEEHEEFHGCSEDDTILEDIRTLDGTHVVGGAPIQPNELLQKWLYEKSNSEDDSGSDEDGDSIRHTMMEAECQHKASVMLIVPQDRLFKALYDSRYEFSRQFIDLVCEDALKQPNNTPLLRNVEHILGHTLENNRRTANHITTWTMKLGFLGACRRGLAILLDARGFIFSDDLIDAMSTMISYHTAVDANGVPKWHAWLEAILPENMNVENFLKIFLSIDSRWKSQGKYTEEENNDETETECEDDEEDDSEDDSENDTKTDSENDSENSNENDSGNSNENDSGNDSEEDSESASEGGDESQQEEGAKRDHDQEHGKYNTLRTSLRDWIVSRVERELHSYAIMYPYRVRASIIGLIRVSGAKWVMNK